MQIDRSNYEIWFIDWLDGNLSDLQAEQLKVFLDQNPDLTEEFNDLTPVNIVPSGIQFHYKENLKKSPSDISSSQFEYLSAAYLENDLDESQVEELKEIIISDPSRKKTFDLIQKTRIFPKKIQYKQKDRLLRRKTLQRVLWLSFAGLSTAAAIFLIIITYVVKPDTASLRAGSPAHNLISDRKIQKPSSAPDSNPYITPDRPVITENKTEKRHAGFNRTVAMPSTHNTPDTLSIDSSLRKTDHQNITINKIPVYGHPDIKNDIPGNSLIACNPDQNVPDIKEERTTVGKFISKTFREKLLKEKKPAEGPLKGYEIAEAGVNGLNKLLGWQMALDRKKDEDGQPKSIYFKSKILTINAPVKKRELQP